MLPDLRVLHSSDKCLDVSHVLLLPEIFRLHEGRQTMEHSLSRPLAPKVERGKTVTLITRTLHGERLVTKRIS